LEDLLAGALFHYPARLHHHHLIGDLPDHGQVVGNEQVTQAESGLLLPQQLWNLSLNRSVQCRQRFIEHQ
jgi:hypothetical protein